MLRKQLKRFVIISLLVLDLGITAEGAKVWSGASSITAVQGQSVTMQWIISLTSIDSSKTWTYAKIIQVQDGRTTDLMSLQKSGIKTINDPRYRSREADLNLNVSQSGATVAIKLTINNLVRSMDEKHYKAMLGFSSDSSTFPGATSLIIQERPHSTTIAASPNQTSYCVQDNITITCASRAYPSANYNLYRNNQILQSGGSSGVFEVSTAVTDRVFTCVPYNTVGTGQNRSFQVVIKAPSVFISQNIDTRAVLYPLIKSTEPPKILWCKINEATTTNKTVVEGSKVMMICKMSGSEPMDVTWIRINASPPLRWNQRNLTFNAISRKEEGLYRMNVYNGKECNTTESVTFHVEVHYKPVGTSISVFSNQSTFCMNDHILITCKTEAKPLPEFSLYQNNRLINKGSKSGSFKLFLLFKGEIVLNCVPSNAVGSGQSNSLRVFVKEPPSISRCKMNNNDQTNITVNEGAKVTFHCEFSGTRPLNVTWTKESQTDVHWNHWNLTINSVHRSDHGIYRVTVYNGKECNTAVSRTLSLVVNYMSKLQVMGNSFNVFNKSTTLIKFEILIDAYPDVVLTCQSAQLKEFIFIQQKKKESTKTQFIVTVNTTNADSNIRLICTAENEVDSQTTGFLIYKQGDAKIVVGSMKLEGQDWRQDLSNVENEAHKKLKRKCMKMLYDVYNDIPYVENWDVLRFSPGSVIMNFHLLVIADVSDPFSPIKTAVDKNGGFVGNLQIDPTSIRKTDVADIKGSKQSQSTSSTDTIIAFLGVIMAVSLLINIILIILLLRSKAASKKKRHVYDDPNLVTRHSDGHHQDSISLGSRTPDLDNDQLYQEVCNSQVVSQSQPQANEGRDNPVFDRSLPALPTEINENQEQTQDISSTSRPLKEDVAVDKLSIENKNKRQNTEAINEPSKPLTPEVGAKNSKGYNVLDLSTKLPPRDNRPALENQTCESQMPSLITKQKYQNQEERQSPRNSQDNKIVAVDERKPQKTCEAPMSNVGSANELQIESSKDYNRLAREPIIPQLTKKSEHVSEQDYEISMPKEQNQKGTQSPRNSQDDEAVAVERNPQKTSEALKHTDDNKTESDLQNEISEELESPGSNNETTA